MASRYIAQNKTQRKKPGFKYNICIHKRDKSKSEMLRKMTKVQFLILYESL